MRLRASRDSGERTCLDLDARCFISLQRREEDRRLCSGQERERREFSGRPTADIRLRQIDLSRSLILSEVLLSAWLTSAVGVRLMREVLGESKRITNSRKA